MSSALRQVLELGRWAPSGDNLQPWRFEISAQRQVVIHIHAQGDVYDFGGLPTLMTPGFLLESLRLAATTVGWQMTWRREDQRLVVDFTPAELIADPLASLLPVRSVARSRYRWTPLTDAQRLQLSDTLGSDWSIHWLQTPGERWRVSRVNALATDIRLRIPEAYSVHQRILDWEQARSPDRIPSTALGIDPMTLRLMRWVMADWSRSDVMNRYFGGTVMPRVQLDLIPGLFCAAHFAVMPNARFDPQEPLRLLDLGMRMQRFWLTATALGLVLQPSFAPLCFAYYGARNLPFTTDPACRAKAVTLAHAVVTLCPGATQPIVFLGRIGQPLNNSPGPRSVRLPLEELLVISKDVADQSRV